MAKMPLLSFLVASALLVSGCHWYQSHNNSVGVFPTDAKQRLLISRTASEGPYAGRVAPNDVVCAEPSPDIAQAVSDALSANLNVEKGALKVGGTLSNSYAESVVQLGERLGTIQLLRDKMFRACEAYANGAISATTYTLLMSRLDKSITTLMLAEMSAGAFGRGLASVGGAAQASAIRDAKLEELALKAVEDADKTVKDRQKAADQAAADADKNSTDESKKLASTKAQQDLQGAQEDLKQKQDTLNAVLHQVSLATSTSSTIGTNLGTINGRSGSPSDGVVHQISTMQRQYLDTGDEISLLDACITALDLVEKPARSKEVDDLAVKLDSTNQEMLGYKGAKLDIPEQVTAKGNLYVDQAQKALGKNLSPLAQYCSNGGLAQIITSVGGVKQARYEREKAYIDLTRERISFCNAVLTKGTVSQPELTKMTMACLDQSADLSMPQFQAKEKAQTVDTPIRSDIAPPGTPIETTPKPVSIAPAPH